MLIRPIKPLYFIALENVSIFEQLQLEEALVRSDKRDFCLVNIGSPRAIVMGISGEPTALLDIEKVRAGRVPVYRRFSGGGTVVVDEATLFVTFIFSQDSLPLAPFPEPILRWTADFYTKAWEIPQFSLVENDYAIENRKCGGNAQYIKKDRWLHHTSFLFDYAKENMDLLLLPKKRPLYRQDRSHEQFLCRLSAYRKTPDELVSAVRDELVKRFYIEEFDVASFEKAPHRRATQRVEC